MKHTIIATCIVALAVTGCANTGVSGMPIVPGFSARQADNWQPTIDRRDGFDQARYDQDFTECRAYAEENPEADPEQAARDGAVRSGLMAAAGSVIMGVASGGILIPVAAVTGLYGGNRAHQEAIARHRSIIASCLSGRGYSVIG